MLSFHSLSDCKNDSIRSKAPQGATYYALLELTSENTSSERWAIARHVMRTPSMIEEFELPADQLGLEGSNSYLITFARHN